MGETYVAFLRSVNVAKRQYRMERLRATLTAAGFGDVETHIQTGNVRFTTTLRDREQIVDQLERAMLEDVGFEVPVVLMTPAELVEIAAIADEVDDGVPPEHGHYVELLAREPDGEGTKLLEGREEGGQRVVVRGRAVHLLYDMPYHSAKAPNAAMKRALGVSTNRNVKVVRALAEKWGSDG